MTGVRDYPIDLLKHNVVAFGEGGEGPEPADSRDHDGGDSIWGREFRSWWRHYRAFRSSTAPYIPSQRLL